ncbi:MAG: biotin/lipoyl-containing protein, partial [Steroidobacteraceae bacterium]
MSRIELLVPDLGNNNDVSVVDVLIKVGDTVEVDTPLVTLETDKASLDVPATSAGKIAEVLLKRGDKVSKGSIIARVEVGAAQAASNAQQPQPASSSQGAPAGQGGATQGAGTAAQGAGAAVQGGAAAQGATAQRGT